MADTLPEQQADRRLPHQQISPAWIAQNLALLGAGAGLGYYAGGAAAHYGAQKAWPGYLSRLSPQQREAFFRGAGTAAGAGSALALNQARSLMAERLREKRQAHDAGRASQSAPSSQGRGSLREAMGTP